MDSILLRQVERVRHNPSKRDPFAGVNTGFVLDTGLQAYLYDGGEGY